MLCLPNEYKYEEEMRILFFVISLKATTSFALKISTVCCSTSRCTASQLLNWVSCAGGLPWRISICSRASPHPFNWPKEEVRRTVGTDGIQTAAGPPDSCLLLQPIHLLRTTQSSPSHQFRRSPTRHACRRIYHFSFILLTSMSSSDFIANLTAYASGTQEARNG